ASDGQHLDNHTRVDHRVGPARSEQEYRGIATGSGRAVWNGKAIVHPGADGTDARQANHNLLLSGRAEIDAKPELEIYADDVRCSHGATIGQLDANALYYLQTRGIARREAERLLTRAFAHSVVARNPVPVLVDHVEALVDERLAGMLGESAA
ncbi:MAG: SufD family Fe-S cluster assembly protein, partial [Woeseiaceae bacterium]|nr:SufD family Fe-S cluster assembly protein [Woeseiaceae bacterium]